MRHLRLLALLAPALLLPIACEDSSGSSSGAVFAPEGGPGFEAGPPLGPLPDGALPDSSLPDTSTKPLGVTVTVFDGATPKKDVRVIFHDAAGLVTGQAVTDAAGKASVAAAPSMVTVLTTDGQSPSAVTFGGVADGDNLKVVGRTQFASAGTFGVTFTDSALIVNANSFSVQAGSNCYANTGSVAATLSVPLFGDCVAAKNVVLATAANFGTVLGFGFMKNVDAPVGLGNVPVGPLAFSAPGTTTVTATNLPTGGGVNTSASLSAIAGGQGNPMGYSTGTLAGGGVVFPTATGFADAYQAAVHATSNGASSDRSLVRREATAAPASAALTAFDFSTALPAISDVAVAQAVPARPDMTLTTADPAALATSDAGIVRLSWFVAAVDTTATWTFVLPPGTTAFKAPALPADATDFVPVTDSFAVDSATFFDASQLPSYGAAKVLPITPGSGLDLIESTRVLPAAGTLRISRFAPNNG